MNIRNRKSSGGGGSRSVGGNTGGLLSFKTIFAFFLIALPQLATSTVLDKLRDDPDLSQVSYHKYIYFVY